LLQLNYIFKLGAVQKIKDHNYQFYINFIYVKITI
jgi:hypothetical protein